MISSRFPATHPRAGHLTDFRRKMLCGVLTGEAKMHTIRQNYERWAMIATEVNAGRAVLSCRQWLGAPYRSKPVEFLQVKSLGVQGVKMWMVAGKISGGMVDVRREVMVDGVRLSRQSVYELMRNDGLSFDDFDHWFGIKEFNGVIIHFTRLRYPIAGWFEHESIRYRYSKEEVHAADEFQKGQRREQGL